MSQDFLKSEVDCKKEVAEREQIQKINDKLDSVISLLHSLVYRTGFGGERNDKNKN